MEVFEKKWVEVTKTVKVISSVQKEYVSSFDKWLTNKRAMAL